jgi:protein transport protein SEC24
MLIKAFIPNTGSDNNKRLHNLLSSIRDLRLRQNTTYPNLYIVREDGDPALRLWVLSHFIEDRIGSNWSYPQFLATIRDKVQKMN